ncbi:MAG: hypothetical protein ABW184_10590 [Sphingobium sp.]
MYHKLTVAILIAAPLIAEFAERSATTMHDRAATAATFPDPARHVSPPPQGFAPSGPIDPTPSVDLGAGQPAAIPSQRQEAPPLPPPMVNPIGPVTPVTLREPRY